MIEHLYNWTFFIFGLTLYAVIILLTAKRLKVFEYIGSLKFTQNISTKLTGHKFYSHIQNFTKNSLKPLISIAVNKVISPALIFSYNILLVSSKKIFSGSITVEKYVSETAADGFELLCLLSRKLINSESGAIWTGILAVLVLFYIILTSF